jgi:hypothetical protein
MKYPGGKGASGAYQQIINQIPPHRVYVEAFVGGGAVFERKAPAASSILLDLDPDVVGYWKWRCQQLDQASLESVVQASSVHVENADATRWLAERQWQGDEFVYLDPPYHPDSRTKQKIYRCEMDDAGHRALLDVLVRLPVPFALSGYRCALYDDVSSSAGWRRIDYPCMTRRGVRTESLWMNYAAPADLADFGYVGSGFRERERIKRKVARWLAKLDGLPAVERAALLSAMRDRYEQPVKREGLHHDEPGGKGPPGERVSCHPQGSGAHAHPAVESLSHERYPTHPPRAV